MPFLDRRHAQRLHFRQVESEVLDEQRAQRRAIGELPERDCVSRRIVTSRFITETQPSSVSARSMMRLTNDEAGCVAV